MSPPRRGARIPAVVAIATAAFLGIAAGVGAFTFGYARGASYLTDDPAACANCHVMREHFVRWSRSPHRSAAVCNDCHAPAGPVAKYVVKALNGFNHSWAFTTGRFPDRIHVTSLNARVASASCLKCHEQIVSDLRAVRRGDAVDCLHCHPSVGHP